MNRQVGTLADSERLGPGAHVCCVIGSTAQFEAWTAACLAEGAERGQKLFRFAPWAALDGLPVDASVTVADPHVAFLDEGPVDAAAMYAMFRRQDRAARREGYRGLRLVADMDWLLACPPSRAELVRFEVLLDQVVTELDATVVCAYRREHFDTVMIAEMVAVHPLTAGQVTSEPGLRVFNVSPAVWEVTGEVDHFNAEPFGRAIAAAADGTSSLRLRTAGLRFVAVAGIQALARVARSRPDLHLTIEDANVTLRHCWTLLDLDRQLPGVRWQPDPASPLPPGDVRAPAAPRVDVP
jgi:hypothetical protein